MAGGTNDARLARLAGETRAHQDVSADQRRQLDAELYEAYHADPAITYQQLATRAGMARSSVARAVYRETWRRAAEEAGA